MQQIIQPLIKAEAHRFLLQRRIFFLHYPLDIVCILHNIHKNPGKIIPFLPPGIAAHTVIYMIKLLRKDTDALRLLQKLHQQVKILVQLPLREPFLPEKASSRQLGTEGTVPPVQQQLPQEGFPGQKSHLFRRRTYIRPLLPVFINLIPGSLDDAVTARLHLFHQPFIHIRINKIVAVHKAQIFPARLLQP